MPTSAISPRPDPRTSGFTLLEVVVVLALLALATALVAPQGFRMIETWRRATDVDAALGALAALGAEARHQGRRLEFPAGVLPDDAIGGVPAGWEVMLATPLAVEPNGACADVQGELRYQGYARRFALEAPFCRIVLDPPASP